MTGLFLVVALIAVLSSIRFDHIIVQNRGALLSQLASGMAYQLNQDMRNRAIEIQTLTKLADIQNPNVSFDQKRTILEKCGHPILTTLGLV